MRDTNNGEIIHYLEYIFKTTKQMKNLKLFASILFVVLSLQIAKAQSTYQTARRIQFSMFVNTDSNAVLQSGIQTGCVQVTSQPVWLTFGFCGSSPERVEFSANRLWSATSPDTVSYISYGPFTDTLNLASKLIISNSFDCGNRVYTSSSIFPFSSLDLPNYQRGNIYIFLITSTKGISQISADNGFSSGFIAQDTAYCPFCNGRLSQLFQPVCAITYDSASQKNKLIWDKDVFTPAQDYVVYRQNAIGTYDTVAYQSISQLSQVIDQSSSPNTQSYSYRMGILDSCGHLMNKNNIGQFGNPPYVTIHLIAYPSGANAAGLIWNNPAGTNFMGPFLIYRADQAGNILLIDSISGSSSTLTYTDVNAPAGANSYQIGLRKNPPCVASIVPTYDLIKSNYGNVIVTGINEITDVSSAITVQPNPMNDFTKIDLHSLSTKNLKVVLQNVMAQQVLRFDDIRSSELIIHKNNLAAGLYFIELIGDNFYARKKLVIN